MLYAALRWWRFLVVFFSPLLIHWNPISAISADPTEKSIAQVIWFVFFSGSYGYLTSEQQSARVGYAPNLRIFYHFILIWYSLRKPELLRRCDDSAAIRHPSKMDSGHWALSRLSYKIIIIISLTFCQKKEKKKIRREEREKMLFAFTKS